MKTRHRFNTTYRDILLPVSSVELQGQQISDSTCNPSYLLITFNKTLPINLPIEARLTFCHKTCSICPDTGYDFLYFSGVFNTMCTHTCTHTHTHIRISFPPNTFWPWSWEWLPDIPGLDEARDVKCPTKCQTWRRYSPAVLFSFHVTAATWPRESLPTSQKGFLLLQKSRQVSKNLTLSRIHDNDLQSGRCSIKVKQNKNTH